MKRFLKVKFLTVIALTILISNNSFAQNQRSTSINGSNKSFKSNLSTPVRTTKKLYLKAFFQGLYNYKTHGMNKTQDINHTTGQLFPKYPGAIADSVSVTCFYLDTVNFGNSIIDYYYNITFDTNGVFTPITIMRNDTMPFYIVINHRNSIETWSAVKFKFNGNDSIYYDFSNSVTKAYGNNLIQLAPNIAGIYAGDVGFDLAYPSADGIINIFDESSIWDAMYDPTGVYSNGYVCQDLNGDGSVDIYDLNIIINNMGVQSVWP